VAAQLPEELFARDQIASIGLSDASLKVGELLER
jgi:hypothetical protein